MWKCCENTCLGTWLVKAAIAKKGPKDLVD